MKIVLFSFSFFVSILFCNAQRLKPFIPDEIKKFILKDHEVMIFEEGDLNNDGRKDAILVLQNKNEHEAGEDSLVRPFFILLRNNKGELYEALRNDSLMPKFNYIFFDQDISIKAPDVFELFTGGGRRFKWTYIYRFKYLKSDKQWHLISQIESGFDSGEMKDDPTITVGEEELIGITASNFLYDGHYDETQWRVIKDKVFFYTSPNLKSIHRKAYVVKGDVLKIHSETVNFVLADFDSKDKFTTGYIAKKDLEKINPSKNIHK